MDENNLLAHAEHSVNLLDSEPVENIWHQSLEAHILHTGDVLGSLEILGCT